MPEFSKKTLVAPNQSVGAVLREARHTKGWTLERVSTKTKLMKEHLLALENDTCTGLSTVYRRQFIKKYALALGVDPEPLLAENCLDEVIVPKKSSRSGRWHLSNMPSLLRWSLTSTIALLCLTYLGLQIRQTVRPPELTLIGPVEGLISHTPAVNINGLTEPEVKITINGQAVMSNEQGEFNQPLTLQPGINTVVVVAEKKHGKTTQTTRHIIYRVTPQVGLSDVILGGT